MHERGLLPMNNKNKSNGNPNGNSCRPINGIVTIKKSYTAQQPSLYRKMTGRSFSLFKKSG
jgi:hypothetical protein